MTVEKIRISQEEESIQDVALDSPEAPASLCIACSVDVGSEETKL